MQEYRGRLYPALRKTHAQYLSFFGVYQYTFPPEGALGYEAGMHRITYSILSNHDSKQTRARGLFSAVIVPGSANEGEVCRRPRCP